jgi:hypothetical protein
MPIRKWGFVLSLVFLAAAGSVPAKSKPVVPAPGGPGFALLDRVGSDPLLIWAMRTDDLGSDLDAMMEMLGKFLPEAERGKVEDGLSKLDQRLGLSFRDDFLSQLGPEIVLTLDLPPVDTLIGQVASGQPEGMAQALSGVGILAGVRDPARFERALRRLLEMGHATVREQEGVMEALFQAEGNPVPVKLTWSIRERVLALGLSREWIAAASTARAAGTRAAEGADFAKVFGQLDPRPATLFYLNLPKAARMIRESQFLQAMLSANPEGTRTLTAFLAPEMTGVGVGYTSVRVGEGTRTASFGPSWMSSGGMMAGMVGAVALPNFLNAVDRGKQKRTVADLKEAGTALAAYALDHGDHYPKAESWRPLGEVVAEVHGLDGWGNALEYWSDGSRYVIVSRGKDGETERDWRHHDGVGGARPALEADIVLADGELVAWPGEPE